MLSTTLGSPEGPTIGTYYDIEIRSLAGFTYGTLYDNFDGLLLRARLWLVDRLQLGIVEVTELGFWYGELLGTTLGEITILFL